MTFLKSGLCIFYNELRNNGFGMKMSKYVIGFLLAELRVVYVEGLKMTEKNLMIQTLICSSDCNILASLSLITLINLSITYHR